MNSILQSFSDEDFAQIISSSHSFKEAAIKMGYQNGTNGGVYQRIKDRIEKQGLSIDHFGKNSLRPTIAEDVLCENSSNSYDTIRRWFAKGKYVPYQCAICGQGPKWNEQELSLVLVHINEDKHDNRPENLQWQCPNCYSQTKSKLHSVTASIKKPAKKNYCIDCGKEISSNAIRCRECASKHMSSIDILDISREDFKDLIRTTPFTQIAKQYGVTFNTVQSWCKRLNLPSQVRKIKAYSDEEWAKI